MIGTFREYRRAGCGARWALRAAWNIRRGRWQAHV